MALPIYTHIPNLKFLTKIFFKLSRPKGNLCGGVTVLNPKYPRLSSGDTINRQFQWLIKKKIQISCFSKLTLTSLVFVQIPDSSQKLHPTHKIYQEQKQLLKITVKSDQVKCICTIYLFFIQCILTQIGQITQKSIKTYHGRQFIRN